MTQVDDVSERTNALVAAWILRRYRADGDNAHLIGCPESAVGELNGGDGEYGCDTGCDYVRLDAAITCPHGERADYHYGTFGDLAWIIEGLDAEKDPNL